MPESYQSILNAARQRFAKGGAFAGGALAELERTKKKMLAAGQQSLVSSGLAGSTVAAGLASKFEEEIGAPQRARIEEARTARQTDIDLALAQLSARAEEGAKERAGQIQRLQMATPSNAERGLDAFGRPMRGTAAFYQAETARINMENAMRGLSTGGGSARIGGGGSAAMPDLYGSASRGGVTPTYLSDVAGGGGAYEPINWGKIPLAGAGITFQTDSITGEQIAYSDGQRIAAIGGSVNDPVKDPRISGLPAGPTAEEQAETAKISTQANQQSAADDSAGGGLDYEAWFRSKPEKWQRKNRLMAPGGPWEWMGRRAMKAELGG